MLPSHCRRTPAGARAREALPHHRGVGEHGLSADERQHAGPVQPSARIVGRDLRSPDRPRRRLLRAGREIAGPGRWRVDPLDRRRHRQPVRRPLRRPHLVARPGQFAHVMSDYYGSARPSAMSGMFRYPIPYSNGIVVQFANLSNVDITTGNQISGQGYGFATIEYREGAGVIVGNLRLRSWCRPRVNAQSIAVGQASTFFAAPGISGYILFYGCDASTGYNFLKKTTGLPPTARRSRSTPTATRPAPHGAETGRKMTSRGSAGTSPGGPRSGGAPGRA